MTSLLTLALIISLLLHLSPAPSAASSNLLFKFPSIGAPETTPAPCTTTEDALKVHLPETPVCQLCLGVLHAGRVLTDNFPLNVLIPTVCGVIPLCSTIESVVRFYFERTPDRLTCNRLLLCEGDWFIDARAQPRLLRALLAPLSDLPPEAPAVEESLKRGIRDAVRKLADATRTPPESRQKLEELAISSVLRARAFLRDIFTFRRPA